MDLRQAGGVVAGAGYFAATVPYIRAALRRKVKPHVLAWAGGAVISGITASAQLMTDPTWSAAVPIASFSYCWLVAMIAYRNGSRVVTRLDKTCLLLGGAGIIAWRLTGIPDAAIALAVAADITVCLPMIAKTYRDPRSEIPGPFVASAAVAVLGATCSLHPSFVDLGWPLYLVSLNALIASLALRRAPFSAVSQAA